MQRGDKLLNVYKGWEILTFAGTRLDVPQAKVHLKYNFSCSDGWSLQEEQNDMVLINENEKYSNYKISIRFGEYLSGNICPVKFKIQIKSVYFGSFKSRKQEFTHKKLLEQVYYHIPWKKHAFFIEDNTHIPFSKNWKWLSSP
jgi:hypothetical protein